jgi:hypothetical protein
MNRLVAQVGNLLFFRLAVGSALVTSSGCGLPIRDTAQRGMAATKTETPEWEQPPEVLPPQKIVAKYINSRRY